MNCPACPSSVLVMADRSGIEIDYCPTCRGVWLDRGELDKIVERSMDAMPQAVVRRDDDDDRRRYEHGDRRYTEQRYAKRKKKGFLGDIFDL